MDEAPRLLDHLDEGCATHHARVKQDLEAQGIPFVEDHRLVRGMDYYTRTTFEFQSAVLGAQAGVGGGGRYDDLVEAIGGPPTPGVGFGTGLERILLALTRSRDDLPQAAGPAAYLVAVDAAGREAAFVLAHELRRAGVPVDLDYVGRSVKGQMKQAGRSRARFALILGQEEVAAGSVTVKHLATGEESRVARGEILTTLTHEEGRA
jgi:histidyl-tRNA synthetase